MARQLPLGKGYHAVGAPDEAVPLQGSDDGGVQLLRAAGSLGDEAEHHRAALPERPFEPGLLPGRLVTASTARTAGGERAEGTARDPSEADGRAEVHERLCASMREGRARPVPDPGDVRVHREDGASEREAAD